MGALVVAPSRQMGKEAACRAALQAEAVTAALLAVTDAHTGTRELDAAVLHALGWQTQAPAPRTRQAWRCRSPLARLWLPMPRITASLDAARDTVPFGWSWGVGVRDGHPFAWCRPARGSDFMEAAHVAAPLALTKAALHGHRALLMAALAGAA